MWSIEREWAEVTGGPGENALPRPQLKETSMGHIYLETRM